MDRTSTTFAITALAVVAITTAGRAQEPVPADTAESLEAIEARLLEELGASDSTEPESARPTPGGGAASLNPDISLITDFLVDLSPDAATLEGGERYQLREVELGVQGAVDPYFRYDAFLGLHEDGIEIEEAYATTLSLPADLQGRLGKFLLPFGKVNLTHRPELPMFDYPLVHREYFGEEGFASTGLWGSWIGDPLGFYQEVSIVAAEGIEPHEHDHDPVEGDAPAEEGSDRGLGQDLGDRLWLAHLKNSIDLSPASNLEIGASWATAIVEEDEVRARTGLWGVDVTWRWKPPQLSKYRSAILQAEAIWRDEAGPAEARAGGFVYGQWQLGRRWFVGARLDRVERPEGEGTLKGGQLVVRWFPTEFSQLRLAYERQDPPAESTLDRLIFQTTFALGPHRPHAF
jgi:hypothetical protein